MATRTVSESRDYFLEQSRLAKQRSWLTQHPQCNTWQIAQLRKMGELRDCHPAGRVAELIAGQIPLIEARTWQELAELFPEWLVVEPPDQKSLRDWRSFEPDDTYAPGPPQPYWQILAATGPDTEISIELSHYDAQSFEVVWRYYWQQSRLTLWATPALFGGGRSLRLLWDRTCTDVAIDRGQRLEQQFLELMGLHGPIALEVDLQDLRMVNLVQSTAWWKPEDLCQLMGVELGGWRTSKDNLADWVDEEHQLHLLAYQSDLDAALAELESRRNQSIAQSIVQLT